MVLDRGLGYIEHTADRFVALALHHHRKHVNLTLGKGTIDRSAQSAEQGSELLNTVYVRLVTAFSMHITAKPSLD